MKRLYPLIGLALSSCSLLVWVNGAKRCSGEAPSCDGQELVTCVNGFEDRTLCEACNAAEGRCGVCGDASLDIGESCFVEAKEKLLLDLPPKTLAVANFTNDPNQNADLLVLTSNGINNSSQFFVGFGGGQFGTSQSTFLAVDDPVAIEAIDFDQQDGPDIIYSNSGGNGIETYLSSPTTPHFFSQRVETSEPLAQDFVLADINGDSLLDAVIACSTSNSFSLVIQDGSQRITEDRANLADEQSINTGRFLVEASDLDDDGDPDLVFATPSSLQLIQTNAQGASFLFQGSLSFSSISALQRFDPDSDQDDDLLVVDADDQVKLLENVGPFDFEESTLFTTAATILFLLVEDLDGDGAQDIIVGLDNNTIEIHRNDGSAFPENLAVHGTPVAARAAHLDEDGRLDLLVASLAPVQFAPFEGLVTIYLSSE